MIRWRCSVPAADQAFETKKRIPGMRRDNDKSPIGSQYAARPRERRCLIGKMLKHAYEQDKLKPIRAMHAEIRRIADSKLQRWASSVPLSARDHSGADIDTKPTRNGIGESRNGCDSLSPFLFAPFFLLSSSPILQAWANTVGPSPSICSLNRMPAPALARII
jgi:hypothetical protein